MVDVPVSLLKNTIVWMPFSALLKSRIVFRGDRRNWSRCVRQSALPRTLRQAMHLAAPGVSRTGPSLRPVSGRVRFQMRGAQMSAHRYRASPLCAIRRDRAVRPIPAIRRCVPQSVSCGRVLLPLPVLMRASSAGVLSPWYPSVFQDETDALSSCYIAVLTRVRPRDTLSVNSQKMPV